MVHHLETKRKHIQRKIVFSEPVMSLSLKRISNNNTLERKSSRSDNRGRVEDLRDLKSEHIEKFKRAGYFNITDIYNTDVTQINKEVDLPWRAIREVKQMVDGNTGFTFSTTDNIVEEISREEASRILINNKLWISIFLFEYALRKFCSKKGEEILKSRNRSTRKMLINQLYNNKKRAQAHTKKISTFTKCSESYVKDVISGRAEMGLTEKERVNILDRDNHRCQMCSSEDELEVHHIIPVSEGGSKNNNNLCTLCAECHLNTAHGGNTAEITYNSKDEFWKVIECQSQHE
jgi:5-methylcytosine-specific restriction endonuclease McrA